LHFREGVVWFLGGHQPSANQFLILDNPDFILRDGPTTIPEEGLCQHAAVLLNDQLILTAGSRACNFSFQAYSLTTYVYDFKTSAWTIIPGSMPIAVVGKIF